jgi:hypothetical protein
VDGSSLNATVGTALTIPVAATDKNGDTVKLSYTGSDGSSGSIPAAFDAAGGAWSGNFQWTPAAATPAEVTFTFTATDAPDDASVTPKSSSVSVTVKVSDNGGGGGDITAVNISRAFWSKRGHKLNVAGTVTAAEGGDLKGRAVTVSDSASGEVIGTAKVKRRGTWKLKKRLEIAPCAITASVDGLTASLDVSRAPSDCGTGSGGDDDDDDDHHGDDHHGHGSDDHHGGLDDDHHGRKRHDD